MLQGNTGVGDSLLPSLCSSTIREGLRKSRGKPPRGGVASLVISAGGVMAARGGQKQWFCCSQSTAKPIFLHFLDFLKSFDCVELVTYKHSELWYPSPIPNSHPPTLSPLANYSAAARGHDRISSVNIDVWTYMYVHQIRALSKEHDQSTVLCSV